MIIQNYLLDIYYNVFKYELLIYKCKIIIRIIKHIKYKNIKIYMIQISIFGLNYK